MAKLISIIIPVKNGANYIEEAIENIQKQNMNIEIIVVNDASDDNTAEIAETLGCKVINHEICKGQVTAKNTGLKEARGNYIMFHDHDDIMNEGTLKKLYDELEHEPEISLVMAKVQDFISPDCKDNTAQIKKEPYWGLFTGAVLIRREVFDKIGLFEENINTGEIISLTMKMTQAGLKQKKLDFVATMRRVHNTNYGKTNAKKEFQDYASVLRARMKR